MTNSNLSNRLCVNPHVSLVLIWCNILCDSTKNIKRYAITPPTISHDMSVTHDIKRCETPMQKLQEIIIPEWELSHSTHFCGCFFLLSHTVLLIYSQFYDIMISVRQTWICFWNQQYFKIVLFNKPPCIAKIVL